MANQLSIIIPCFNEQESIPLFYQATQVVANQLPDYQFEYLFINDGSSDESLAQMKQLQQQDTQHVHYISFSRNFGKEAAMYAGLKKAHGDYICIMDADLQDPPELLVEMLNGITKEGYDCVGTRRVNRNGEPKTRSFFAKSFYRIINKISKTEIIDGTRDYRLMTRQMVNAILEMTEYNRFSKGIFSWVGFKTKYLPYENRDRIAGTTSWSFWGLFKYSLEGIIAFSEFPLALASFIGFFSFILATLALIFIVVRALIYGDPTAGWPSMISIMLMIGGLQLLCLGILGKYIGNIYLEVKNRPLYIIKESK